MYKATYKENSTDIVVSQLTDTQEERFKELKCSDEFFYTEMIDNKLVVCFDFYADTEEGAKRKAVKRLIEKYQSKKADADFLAKTIRKAYPPLMQNHFTDEEFYEQIKEYREVCKGCMNENCAMCNFKTIIDCYLRKTFLPNTMWGMACGKDLTKEMCDKYAKEVDKRILEDLKKEGKI